MNTLLKVGLTSKKSGIFLELKSGTSIYDLINSKVNSEEIKKNLKERCTVHLSQEEKLFLGFFSGCKNIIIGKYPDWKAWSSVTSRTQRKYQAAYDATIVNFSHLKKLFSYITNLSLKKIEKIISNLEEKGLLIQEKDPRCGFPGYNIIYRVPIEFDFDYDATPLRLKAKKYIEFLSEDIDKNYNQLIFLDHLVQSYDTYQREFFVDASLMKTLLEFLNYTPPGKYLPVYSFEDDVIILHPWIKEELKKGIYDLKSKLVAPIKDVILESTKTYQNTMLYNFSEKTTKEGYFIVEIESPDPSVETVSFVVTPWTYTSDMKRINTICEKSGTINMIVLYPNYPKIKKMLSDVQNYNLAIIRGKEAYILLKRLDSISQTVFEALRNRFKIIKEEEKVKDELEELIKMYPNLAKVRNAIPEAEKLLRDAIRARLIREFGEKWEEKLTQEFPQESKVWERRKKAWKEAPKKDSLDFALLGQLKSMVDRLPFLTDCFKDFKLAKVSLEIFLRKKVYHHGRPKSDLSEEEVDVVLAAYRNLKQLIRRS